jgi:hypothetical protein
MSQDTTQPTEPVDALDELLTASELTVVCLVIATVTAVWLAALAFAAGFAWQRWLAEFVGRSLAWLVLP